MPGQSILLSLPVSQGPELNWSSVELSLEPQAGDMRNVMHSRIVQFPTYMRALGARGSGPMLGTQATEMLSAAGELTAVCKGQHDWISAQWGTDLTSYCNLSHF